MVATVKTPELAELAATVKPSAAEHSYAPASPGNPLEKIGGSASLDLIRQLDGKSALNPGALNAESIKDGKGFGEELAVFASGGNKPQAQEEGLFATIPGIFDIASYAKASGIVPAPEEAQITSAGNPREIAQSAIPLMTDMTHVEAHPTAAAAGAGVKPVQEQGRGIPA